jgi:hypothetical protein
MHGSWQKENVNKAQQHQKKSMIKMLKNPKYELVIVFIFMPAAKQGPAYTFSRPFHGPYRVKERRESTILACPVGKPNSTPIHVSLNRVHISPNQIPDVLWPSNQQDTQPQPVLQVTR